MKKAADHLPENQNSTKTTAWERIQNSPKVGIDELEALSREETDRIDSEKLSDNQARIEKAIGQAGIPKRFIGKKFEQYVAESNDQDKAKQTCIAFAGNFDSALESGTCLILTGKPGTGKTHLALAILNDVIRHKHTGLFLPVSDALRRIRSSFGSNQSEQDVFDSLVAPDLLVLDEVGVSIGSAEKIKAMLFDILNARYNDMKPTILLGNLTVAEMGNYLGERVMDRMRENGGMCIPFEWESQRK